MIAHSADILSIQPDICDKVQVAPELFSFYHKI